MTTASRLPSAAPHAFQFRIGTLLIATTWAALISLGLRAPTALWSGVIAVLTLLTVLMAVLIVIYRTGRMRAMAIGFLVFCVGYLSYLAILAGTLSSGLVDNSTPAGELLGPLFEVVHPEQSRRDIDLTFPGSAVVIGGTQRVPPFDKRDFISICNHALACLLGVAGAIAAQILHATQRRETVTNS